jgi:hypothetical protein
MEPITTSWSRLLDPAVLIGLLTFMTLVAGWIRSDIVDKRKRRWDHEDRTREKAEEALARDRIAQELKSEGLRVAAELRRSGDALARDLKASEREKAIALEKLAEHQRKIASDLKDTEHAKQIALEQVATEQRERSRTLNAKIDENTALTQTLQVSMNENTEISTRAFHEANTVNNKIASLGVEILQVETDKVGREVGRVLEEKEREREREG